ncbi:unnamed protein product [Anisakis simplex]|uniref:THAP-type domain-containing protein n=1 Tax=Anisakis simplex TaxID=6269 RepID=A0A0M3JY46_ANISI|nr:unnamed protein product [Anisakis simplex]
MRNAKSLNENDYELYLLPNDVVERGKWLAAIRKGRPDFTIPSVPSLSTRNKFYVCERHFSTKKFDIPVKRLMPNDNENSSSNTETSDSDSDEEIIPEETTLTAEQKEKYRSLMTIVLERRPMFKCLVRCCPITNHLVKPDQLRPYTFFELPRIPTVRAHWLDALYLSDSAFEFPPPLIGCGKYAVCERHFCVGKLNASTSRKVPFSVIPTVNLTPQSARNIQLDAKLPPSQTTALRMKAISRCMNNHSDQQLKREMRALFTRWCCREVPEIHKIIARLSCKIDRLHDLVVRLCGVYGVEPVFPAEFDALEDDRVYGRNAVVGSLMPNASEALQLEKALEGLIAITANVTTDNKSQAAEVSNGRDQGSSLLQKSVEIDERNDEVSNDDGEVRFEGMSHLEKQIVTMNNEGDVLKTSESVHSQSSAGRSLSPNSATGRVGATFDDSITADWSGGVSGESSVDKLEDIIILRDSSDEEGDGIEQHSSNQYCTNDSTNEQEKSENSSGGDVSADDDEKDEADATSGCDELTSEWNNVQSRTERQESINGTDMNGGATIGAEDEIAPSLSPHVEDGPPLLFTEVCLGFDLGALFVVCGEWFIDKGMSLLNPASISLGGDDDVLDDSSVPIVGASVVIEQDQDPDQMMDESAIGNHSGGGARMQVDENGGEETLEDDDDEEADSIEDSIEEHLSNIQHLQHPHQQQETIITVPQGMLLDEQELRNGTAAHKSGMVVASMGRIQPKPSELLRATLDSLREYETQGTTYVRRIPVEKITPQLYMDFVTEMTGGQVHTTDPEYREVLDALLDGNEFSVVACDMNDEILGHLDYVMMHQPSKRFVLLPEQRDRVIEACVERFRNEQHPIGASLQYIQKNYLGFPPIIRLRNILLNCLERLGGGSPSFEGNISRSSPAGSMGHSNEMVAKELVGANEAYTNMNNTQQAAMMSAGSSDDIKQRRSNVVKPVKYSGKEVLSAAPMVTSDLPIPDNQYDTLAQILAGKMNIEEVKDWMLREAIKARLNGELTAEYWNEPGEFLPAGWRIRMRDSMKILPRKGEVEEIWRRCYEKLGETYNQKQILAYLEERYAGVATKSRLRVINKDQILKGSRVQFPSKPKCLGSKPMQYVQIDMIEMDSSEYGDRCYNMALLVTDLYSQYVFGRALSDSLDPSLLVRHLMDIFGAFAPPEAFRSYTNHLVIEHVMSDIEKLFKIQIKNVGQGVMNYFNLRTSMYKRAEEELGSRERWVEALPFAVIEYNQKPLRGFGDVRISPFEIMFGRRPWKDQTVPPWISNTEYGKGSDDEDEFNTERKRAIESIGGHSELGGEGVDKSTLAQQQQFKKVPKPDPGATLANIYLGEMAENRGKISFVMGKYPPKYDENGRITDPGTGYIYEIGDHVYMRNVIHRDFFHKSRKRSNIPRYFRATIIEIDHENPDFMYRVLFWDDIPNLDSLPEDHWPDQNEECLCAWVSPFDVTASTPDLGRRRNIVKKREMEYQCKCGYDFCELVYSEKCPFKMSQACCNRRKMDCPYHKRQVEPPPPPKMPEIKRKPLLPATISAEDLAKLASGSKDSKWLYQDGRLIEIPEGTSFVEARIGLPPPQQPLSAAALLRSGTGRAPLLSTSHGTPRSINRNLPPSAKRARLEDDDFGDLDLGPITESMPPRSQLRVFQSTPTPSNRMRYFSQPSSGAIRFMQTPQNNGSAGASRRTTPSNVTARTPTTRVTRSSAAAVSRIVQETVPPSKPARTTRNSGSGSAVKQKSVTDTSETTARTTPITTVAASTITTPSPQTAKATGSGKGGKRVSAPPKRLSPSPQGQK